ncbi:transposase [Dankookia rubra]|nr:transposase [Dankookia rubra]
MLRERDRREPSPTAAIVDTQSAKNTESSGLRGWDATKRLKGRKRHVALDTDGLLLGVVVHAADIQDADGLGGLLRPVKPLYNSLRAVFADGVYNRVTALFACFLFGLALIIGTAPRAPRASSCCHAGEWSNVPLVGSGDGGACPRTMSNGPRSARRWSHSP